MKNNNEQFENFIRDFDTIRMTQIEKNKIQKNLDLFTQTYVPKPSPYYNSISFFKKSLSLALIAVLAFAVSEPASAKALPGELLYNVKIIHEKIEAATIKTPEKKVSFEIKQTETRIREAVKLAETKKLDTVVQVKLAQDIKKHVKEIAEKIREIKVDNPEQALALNSDLKTTLVVNSKALKEVTTKKKRKNKRKSIKIIKKVEEEMPIPEIELINDSHLEIPLLEEEIEIKEIPEASILLNIDISEIAETSIELDSDILDDVKLTTESFANLILDSIDDDIEKTEEVSEIIAEEIIAEDKTTKDVVKIDSPETSINEIAGINTTTENIKIETIPTSIEPEISIEIDSPTVEIDNSNLEVAQTEDVLKVIEIVELPEQIIENIELKISSKVQIEITSLEHILNAEEALQILSNELSHERDILKIEEVKELIENKHLGQAFIAIQTEITELSEIKLQQNLISELGINVEIETDENKED